MHTASTDIYSTAQEKRGCRVIKYVCQTPKHTNTRRSLFNGAVDEFGSTLGWAQSEQEGWSRAQGKIECGLICRRKTEGTHWANTQTHTSLQLGGGAALQLMIIFIIDWSVSYLLWWLWLRRLNRSSINHRLESQLLSRSRQSVLERDTNPQLIQTGQASMAPLSFM